ncbi:hypothetical protein FKP32DRAFT_1588852 [Trametes sanguinea]|nr:hypothetical protein FKP32DRAFT_1588852 [Trametes sanguinea]
MANTHQNLDTAVGIIGILTAPPVLGALIYSLLPCTRLRELEQLFAETEGLLQKNAEAGLLGSCDVAFGFHSRLNLLRERVERVQVESHRATTYIQNLMKMLGGLSRRISNICSDVKELRADISTTTARERERLRQAQNTPTQVSCTVEQNSSTPPLPVSEGIASEPPVSTATLSEHDCKYGQAEAGHGPDTGSPNTAPTCSEGDSAVTSSYITRNLSSASLATPPSPSDQRAVAAGAQSLPAAQSIEDLDGDRRFAASHTRASIHRQKRHGDTLSRMRVFARLVRGRPRRALSSSSSTHSLMLVPSRTLASIELASDGDDAEWEDIAVCQVQTV